MTAVPTDIEISRNKNKSVISFKHMSYQRMSSHQRSTNIIVTNSQQRVREGLIRDNHHKEPKFSLLNIHSEMTAIVPSSATHTWKTGFNDYVLTITVVLDK